MPSILPGQQFDPENTRLGGKASGLLFLVRQGFRVPDFYLIPPEITSSLLSGAVKPEALVQDWMSAHQIRADSIWALRSSAGVEDGQALSYAGLFHTEINVEPSKIPEAIEAVLAAYRQVPALEYGSEKEFPFTIVVQEMLRPVYSGVAFSHNPLDVSDQSLWLNIIPGLGIHLVSGREDAFVCRYDNGDWVFADPESDFQGQTNFGVLQDVTRSGAQIVADLKPFLPQILKGMQQLYRLKQFPVDVELAIANGQLYWLQLRPITTPRQLIPVRVWDNANIGDNFPGLSLPLTVSFSRHTYERAYTSLAAFLGMKDGSLYANRSLLANMVGAVHGAMYYNITAWQQMLYQMPFGRLTSRHITKLLGMDEAPFEKPGTGTSLPGYLRLFGNLVAALFRFGKHKSAFEELYADTLSEYRRMDFSGKSHLALVKIYENLEARLAANWTVPVLNGFYAMLFFSSLKWVFRHSRLRDTHPNFINDILYDQGDVVSVRIVRRFRDLQEEVQADPGLRQLFTLQEGEAIIEVLPAEYPVFYEKFCDYVAQFGARCEQGELKMETVDYREDPKRLIGLLRAGAAAEGRNTAEPLPADYRMVLKQAYRNNPLKYRLLRLWIKLTLGRVRDRENYRFWRTDGFAQVRRIFRAVDAVLLQNGIIEQAGDSLYLELEEITRPELSDTYRERIAKRKDDYARFAKTDRAPRYLEDKEGNLEPVFAPAPLGTGIRGLGCSSGAVSAAVGIVNEENAGKTDFSGRILVARYFEPGWVNLFGSAAGVISERGNLLSHTAILCREMGVPAIVGCKGISSMVKDGDMIRMNGATGEVMFEPESEVFQEIHDNTST